MAQNYATVSDMIAIWRSMSKDEMERAEALLPLVCASLRTEAKKLGKNLDEMIAADDDLADVTKSVAVDIVARTLMTATNQEPMTQMTQSALGYSMSGSFLVPGGGLFIKRSELDRLGLRRQRYGVIDFYGND